MGMFKVTVAEVLDETLNIRSFRLTRTDGAPFDAYQAGGHVDIVGPTAVMRQYSLCSPPHDTDSYVVAVKREAESRGGSAALFDQIVVGSELEISAPRNLMRVAPAADQHVLVAAGIGVTPMISIAYHLHREGQPFQLFYYARSRDEAAFADLLEHTSGFGENVHFRFGLERSEQAGALAADLAGLTADSHVYTCGPQGFMERVRDTALLRVPENNVHTEHFQAGAAVDAGQDVPFEVELESGDVYQIPVGKSIVEVLHDNGIEIETSCREGICGTCIMGVLEGEPDHRDQCLSNSERTANDQMATCVSRAKSARLILEQY